MITRRRLMGKRDVPNYMYMEALVDGFQTKLSVNAVEYSVDECKTWTTLSSGYWTPAIALGKKIYFKGTLTPNSSNGIGTFSTNSPFNLGGNAMSLLYGDNFEQYTSVPANAFEQLFMYTNVVEVTKDFLPATTLANRCYNMMFYGCISLIEAPDLPALTLKTYCYGNMFEGCTSLEKAPVLPAISLNGTYCYYYMFRNCKKLNYVKALFKTLPSTSYTTNWLSGVSSTGTFVKASNATWTQTGVSGVPSGWTVITE